MIKNCTKIEDGRTVKCEWHDGTVAKFHSYWLRDNALDAATTEGV